LSLFDYTPIDAVDIDSMLDAAIEACEQRVAGIVSVAGPRSFADTLTPLEEVAAFVAEVDGRGPFLSNVATEENVRQTARAADQRLRQWVTDLEFREDLYRAVKAYSETAEALALEAEKKRFLDFTLRDFLLVGHELPPERRARAQETRQRLVQLEVEFSTNIAEDDSHVILTREDLAGLPDEYIAGLEAGHAEGTYKVTMAYPDVLPFLDNATRRDLRQAVNLIYNNRAAEVNRPILAEALELRAEMAELFDLSSWAEYRFQVKMAKTPKRVEDLYEHLLPRLTSKGKEELRVMTRLLEQETRDRAFRSWDYRFYETTLRKTEFGVDPFEVAKYLPLPQVLEGMFALTGTAFGLEYEEIPEAFAWHGDVKLFRILDRASGAPIAHFYMDLHPRPGKFTHAAAWSLVPGHRSSDGKPAQPVSAIVCNLPKPTPDRPSLLQHDDVVTLFHEFGHVLHMSLSQASFTRFSGASTEWDFVEAPSQIMEHWCWQPEALQTFARHHETGEPIPSAMVEQLVAAKNLNTGLFHLRQISYGKLDLEYHGPGSGKDLERILRETYAIGLIPFPEGTFFPASFGHLLGGYDAGYYGYLWAKVFGDDMFSRFEQEGYTDPIVGMEYRRAILEPNGTKDADELLRDFLGREPSGEAFLRYSGIEP